MGNHEMRNEPKEQAKPVEGKTSRVNSMVLIPKKRNGEEGLMFVDINIAGQKWSALIDTGVSDLFISKKTAKLGLLIKKSNKKIKTVNFEEAPTVGVVYNVELQITEWKGKEDFEVIQLEDYDYVLGLNFLDRIQTFLFPWADQIHSHRSIIKYSCASASGYEGRGTVSGTKPICENLGDFNRNKSKLGQVRAETSCQRDVPTSATVQVKRRRKPK
ncbi:hypothetical protein Gotur_025282 [Gossypium turneri]